MSRPIQAARGLSKGLRAAAVATAILALAACQPQIQQPSDILFAPTFSKSRQNIPSTYNTPYDCRQFTGSGWKGIAGGVVYDFSTRYQISQAGCFKTQAECQSWLSVMRSYIDVPRFIRCNPYNA
ncbi:MAG: hypothetical protein JJ866_16810 [Roseibium sp.]|uniref:hypothetical protein n=1 Tax=Roseibium sp. TaxID=1936156 RepID=UPI001B08BF48|nr:hypothetical protein [Roseibium sp.]MBO6893605.1 hypothetical protein [Roseibium sp.]MBO6928100.1 hypothetical protein [Roseibium sp.]